MYSEQEKTDKNVKRIIAIHMFLDFFHKNILNKKNTKLFHHKINSKKFKSPLPILIPQSYIHVFDCSAFIRCFYLKVPCLGLGHKSLIFVNGITAEFFFHLFSWNFFFSFFSSSFSSFQRLIHAVAYSAFYSFQSLICVVAYLTFLW